MKNHVTETVFISRRWVWLLFSVLLTLCQAPRAAGADLPVTGLPAEVSINGVEFVLIPQGWLWYTVSTGDLGLQPAGAPMFRSLRVWLDSYYMAKYEARARDFVRFMNSGPQPAALMALQAQEIAEAVGNEPLPDSTCTVWRDSVGAYALTDSQRDLPATDVSWTLSDAFAQWMGFRLPTEAEWEKAARGPDLDRRQWPWGDVYPDDTYANFNANSRCHPAPVAMYPKGRSPYGVYNMAGNVEEYVADWYNKQFDASLKDGDRNPALAMAGSPFGFYGPLKISKGGRWNLSAAGILIAERHLVRPHGASNRSGLRFAVDVGTVRLHLEQGTAMTVNKP